MEKHKSYNVKLLEKTDDYAKVAGYGVIYGGEDLEGENFQPDTDFMLDLVPVKLVLYDHGMQKEVKHVVGKASATPDDTGLWVEAQLDIHKRYVEEILQLIDEGILGWSSGSIGHLVEREGKTIKRWPIVEFSLTPTPAEPRTIGVERLKALAEEYPRLKALLPKETGKVSADAEAEPDANLSVPTNHKEKHIMNDVTLSAEEYKELLKAQVKAPDEAPPEPKEANDPAVKALQEQMDQILEIVQNAPSMKDAGYVAPDSEKDHDEVKSFGDFLVAVKRGNTRRLKSVYNTAWDWGDDEEGGQRSHKTALAEDAGTTGGYLVPTQFVEPIMAAAEPYSVLRRAGATVVPMTARSAEVPALDIETAPSAGDTAFAGGVAAYWTAEAGALTESEPKFRLIELVAHKLAGYSLASNEVRADAARSIEAILTMAFGRALGSKENYAFFRGDGVGKPYGILTSNALISATRSAGSTVALADLAQMMSDFLPASWGTGAWFINPEVIDQLIQLVSNPLSWMENIRNANIPVQLMGLPLYVTGALPALNTAGDILLADPTYYLIGDRQALTIAYSEHYKFVNDQGTWRFTHRVDGQPWVFNSITLENASTTVSPFVALAAG